MDIRYQNYRTHKFIEWKRKVRMRHLPQLVIKFYCDKLDGKFSKRHNILEIEKTLGFVIESLANPAYSLVDRSFNPISFENRLTYEIVLEIKVNEVFSFVFGRN